jgi:Mor family transcriptional regulator
MIQQTDIKIEDLPLEFQDMAKRFGIEAALWVIRMRGGEYVYIPRMPSILRTARNRLIRSEFDGSNFRHLARKYHLSTVYIRKIVNTPTSTD